MNPAPSSLLLSKEDIETVWKESKSAALEIVEHALKDRAGGQVLMPDKSSQIYDEILQNRINCMPASLISRKVASVKWVAVFPENPKEGYENVTGTIVLSELSHGHTLSVMDGSLITALRTAAVGGVAVKLLARKNSRVIGFIGTGKEAMNHLDMICLARPELKICKVSSRSDSSVARFIRIESEKHPNLTFLPCGNDFEKAVTGADIIVTATSTQADLLKAKWISPGATYIHVGGWEDEYAVVNMADKIVCDEWESIKHRSQTLSRMYKEGLLAEGDIYADLGQILSGEKKGRECETEFCYFCSVGLAFLDTAFAEYTYNQCKKMGLGTPFRFS